MVRDVLEVDQSPNEGDAHNFSRSLEKMRQCEGWSLRQWGGGSRRFGQTSASRLKRWLPSNVQHLGWRREMRFHACRAAFFRGWTTRLLERFVAGSTKVTVNVSCLVMLTREDDVVRAHPRRGRCARTFHEGQVQCRANDRLGIKPIQCQHEPPRETLGAQNRGQSAPPSMCQRMRRPKHVPHSKSSRKLTRQCGCLGAPEEGGW